MHPSMWGFHPKVYRESRLKTFYKKVTINEFYETSTFF